MTRSTVEPIPITSDAVSRRTFALPKAVIDAIQRVSLRALVPSAVIVIAVTFVAAVIAGFTGMSDAIGPHQPLTTMAAIGALFLFFGATFGVALWRALGGELGGALDVIAWSAAEAQREWAAASPGTRVPRSPKEAGRWLKAHPVTDANRRQRLAASLMIGDLGGARDILTRYPATSALERHQRADDGISLDLVAGRAVPSDEIDTAYRELGSEDQMHAATCRSTTEAFAAVMSAGDWQAPLVRAQRHLPAGAIGVGRRQVWLVLLAMYLVPAAAVAPIASGLWIVAAP